MDHLNGKPVQAVHYPIVLMWYYIDMLKDIAHYLVAMKFIACNQLRGVSKQLPGKA